ncbi:DNA protecting protein DprA [Duganella sp. CF458]|uniref:DNA-processing protein DprA n=1 Tax=Duganella sp. CF458 TaxID=1884368 RepID=UPI0008F0E7C4|nr:DNA-processing protein DprA [Duganella sp. CF458]SFG84753.1 DNA protecting protein DprA [Duganella sp. CF458]
MAVQVTDAPNPARQDSESLAMWLRLANTPGVGRHAASKLLQQYLSPQAVFTAANARLAAPPAQDDAAPLPLRMLDHADAGIVRSGQRPAGDDEDDISIAAARCLAGPMPERLRAMAQASLAWAAQPGNHLVLFGDPEYPPTLRHIADPPLLLYAKGELALLQCESVAVVGARNGTVQGRSNARQFARVLSDAGMTVVSGLALGIDAAAHEGGLEGPGRTVAVIGTGIDRIYPRRNAALAHRIAEQGCLLSEFVLGTAARAEHFPIRNRIIAGMTRATLVIEAAARSGSLITAHAAINAGREVFVLPGSILSPQSVGCHALIREGARLVATPEHLMEDLGLAMPDQAAVQMDQAAGWLLAALGHDPIGADELAIRLQLPPSDMQASLLALELAGVVERLPGGAFQRLKGS